jgi:hypothetical protein
MKRIFTLLIILSAFVSCDVLQQLPGATTTGLPGSITQAEAAQGIREALGQGIGKAVVQLNTTDGFFSSAYKILLPPEALKIEKALRNLGMNQLVDKAILQINRGAEDAAGFAKPIFVDAIKGMTLTDAINIIRGSDTSATNYFRVRTSTRLITAFSPVIQSSLDKVSATRYYGDMINTYNSFPTTINKLNPDLQSYVTLRATNALFDLVAKEEKNIRENPVARTTEILKKVFGNLGR